MFEIVFKELFDFVFESLSLKVLCVCGLLLHFQVLVLENIKV